MAEVGKEKEELVRKNTAHKNELEKLNEENKDTEVELAAGKETLNRVKEKVVELMEKQKKEEMEILEQEIKAEELQKCLEDDQRRSSEVQLKAKGLEKEIEEEKQTSMYLQSEVEAKSEKKEVEMLKKVKVSAQIQEVCKKVAEIKAVKDKLMNGLKELALQRANSEQVLTNLKLRDEEVSAQLVAEDSTHHDYEVQRVEEVKRLEQGRDNLKQVDDELQLKELERSEKEKYATALEAAVKEKEVELEEVARQAECLGKEVAPGEGEAEKAKLLLDELKAKLDQNQTDLAKEKEEEELKLKEVEQEATEVKEMKANLSESMTEAKQVAGDEKMLRKKSKEQKMELANLEAELTKMKSVVESAAGENKKLSEENESLVSTLANLQAEVEAVKKKKLNFGEELNQVTLAQMEKMRHATEKKAKLAAEVDDVKKKVKEADQENAKLAKEVEGSEKTNKEKRQQLEEKKKVLERVTTASTKTQIPASTPAPGPRPKFFTSSIFNKAKDQQGVSRRPALKTDVEKVKLGTSSSNLTPKSTKSAPSGLARTPSKSPSLRDFRESRMSFGEKNKTPTRSAFDFGSSSDEKQADGSQVPTSSRDSFKTPLKERKPGVPLTPTNSGKPQLLESRTRPGPKLFLGQDKNKEQ